MSKADFSQYLKVKVDDIPTSLPSLPAGHFFADLRSWKTDERFYDKTEPKKGTPVVELLFAITGPDDDVDPGQLPESQGVGRTVRKDYTLNDPDSRGQMNLRRVCEKACGVDGKGLELDELLDASVGSSVKVHNTPKAGKNEGEFFDNIDMVLPVG